MFFEKEAGVSVNESIRELQSKYASAKIAT